MKTNQIQFKEIAGESVNRMAAETCYICDKPVGEAWCARIPAGGNETALDGGGKIVLCSPTCALLFFDEPTPPAFQKIQHEYYRLQRASRIAAAARAVPGWHDLNASLSYSRN